MSAGSRELESRERLLRYLDGELSPAETREVEAWLKRDSGARALLSEIAEHAIVIADLARAEGVFTVPAPTGNESKVAAWNQPLLLWSGITALFVLCLTLGAAFLRQAGETAKGSVALLEFVSADAKFSASHQLPFQPGSPLGKGWVQLERGVVRILFRSGASVEVEGPAAFGIDTPMRSYLDYGRARVHAPRSARDFVVATEGMEVVDLGTRFELRVDQDSRDSSVSVSEGLVDLHLGSPGTARRIQPLEAGFTAQIDASGEIVALQRLNGGPPPQPDRHPHFLAHWKLDEVGSGEPVADSGHHQLEGRFQGGGDGGSRVGIAGRALDLGERGYVDLSQHAGRFGDGEDFTIAAWVRDPSERIAIVFSLSGGTEADRVQFHLNRRHVVFGWQSGHHFDAVSGRVDGWEAGRWYHVAVTSQDGLIRLYRDGEPIGSASLGQKIGTRILSPAAVKRPTQAYLGKLGDAASGERRTPQWFGGALDDVQFYASAVNGEGIRFLYENPGEVWQSVPDNH